MNADDFMHITTLRNGRVLKFGPGKIDNFCVYVQHETGVNTFPLDEEYFGDLRTLAGFCGVYKVYGDFVKIYNQTYKLVDKTTLKLIDALADEYPNSADVQELFTILYAAMIAEENRRGTVLGKRIKRLGVRQVLIEGRSPYDSACFSRGMPAEEIDAECKRRGF